jgi:cytochrome c-type biogenesis protein CcmH/NrfG
MKTIKILSFALLASTFTTQAQDLEPAKKAIDAEQFEKAKGLLKSTIQAKPSNGKANFLLGNIYLKQNIADSAAIYFQKGLTASESAKLNHIGLGQMDLDANNHSAAQAKFDMVTKDLKKKDTEELVYIARAYMNADKPNYKKAIEVLNKAKLANPNDAQVQLALGDAFYGDKNQNDAYVAYRNAYQTDNTLIRAKMQLGVLLKGAKAYTEAVKAYNEVITINPNYGPVYRELAETHYLWGNNEPKTYTENIKKALSFYEKYMSLTDYSLNSRMRHADFLILAKDYKALETVANKMKEIDGVNPRILRYLGYSAYENGNIDGALKALTDYTSNPNHKIIAKDYAYLAQAKIKKAITEDGKVFDTTALTDAMTTVKKAIEMEPLIANDLNEIGKKLYEQKAFGAAAGVFEAAVSVPTSKNFLIDNFYLGNALYYDNTGKDADKRDKIALQKADVAFGNVITASPTTQDAYIFRARTNKLLENDQQMSDYYQQYIDVVSAKGEEEITKNKTKFIEAYNNMASHYANSDKAKARELLNKTLTIDTTNSYALESLKLLK